MPQRYLEKILTSRVYDVARVTLLEKAPQLSKRHRCEVLFKREDTQPVHSFKLHGAYNKMAHLSRSSLEKGVIAASAGNHAQGVAYSARTLKTKATIVTESWKKLAGNLPLPLGGSAVKKSLGEETMRALSALQKTSIECAMDHHEEAKAWCLERNPALTSAEADRYLDWYVNRRTLNLGEEERRALEILFDAAFERGLIAQKVSVEII